MPAVTPHDSASPDHPSAAPAPLPTGSGAAPACIVVGIDSSERSADAVGLACHLSRAAGAELVVASICVVESHLPSTLTARDEAWRRIDDVLPALTQLEGWRPAVVEAPSAARGLHELAVGLDAQLLVIGSTHRGPVARAVLGHVARRLLHGSPCAVVVAPRGHRPPPSGTPLVVGVGFDDSAESRLALEGGARWARRLGAALRVVTALELPSVANPMFGTVSRQHTVEAMRAFADDRLAEACAALDVPAGVTYHVRDGDPASVLADESRGVDLLVVGSRAYGPLRTVLLGGVSGPVVERAARPVMVVPRGAAAPARGDGVTVASPVAVGRPEFPSRPTGRAHV